MPDKPWKVLERLVGSLLKSRRYLRKGEESPDVIGSHFCVECKYRQKIAIYKWWKEAENHCKNASKEVKRDLIPVLVLRQLRGQPLVVMDINTWAEIMNNADTIKPVNVEGRIE